MLRHLRYIKEEERAVYAPLLARLSQINDAVQIYDEFAALTGSKLSGMGEPFTPNTVCLREPSMKPREAHYSLAPGEHIAKVGITTLVIHAHDDPITNLSDSYFKRVFDRMLSNPHIVMCTTRRGGHVGWHQNIFPSGPTWADRVASDFLSAVLGNLSEVTFFLTILRNMSKMSEPLVKSPFLLPLERVLSPDGAEPRAYADASAAVPGNHSEAFEPIATLHQRDVIVSPSDADDEGLMIRPANLQRRMSQPLPSARYALKNGFGFTNVCGHVARLMRFPWRRWTSARSKSRISLARRPRWRRARPMGHWRAITRCQISCAQSREDSRLFRARNIIVGRKAADIIKHQHSLGAFPRILYNKYVTFQNKTFYYHQENAFFLFKHHLAAFPAHLVIQSQCTS